MADEHPSLEDLAAMASLFIGASLRLSEIADEHPDLVAELRKFDPLRTASIFSGLLTTPHLQANCGRLETLVHLAITSCGGDKKPTKKNISNWFTALNSGRVGPMEDPAEDVFVNNVHTSAGNFLIYEGIWESSGFYLQRTLSAFEELNSNGDFQDVFESISAILKLSDAICNRRRLKRYILGEEFPQRSIPKRTLDACIQSRRYVKFSRAQLGELGVSLEALSVFEFLPKFRHQLTDELVGHSTLERYPLAYKNDAVYVLLPTAISSAVRRYLYEVFVRNDEHNPLIYALAENYSNSFSKVQLLGGKLGAPIEFKQTPNGILAGITMRADVGRYLNIIFLLDDLKDFEASGLVGTNPDPLALADDIDKWVDHAYEPLCKKPEFRECISLIVGCGIGRGANHVANNKPRENWRCAFLSAADLNTLSWLEDFDPLVFWRILDSQTQIQKSGVELMNANGLVNLVAWSRVLDGHLIPHDSLPEDFRGENLIIQIEQNGLRKLRHEVLIRHDEHSVKSPEGSYSLVRRVTDSLNDKQNEIPIYASDEFDEEKGIPIVYEAENVTWWAELKTQKAALSDHKYQRWLLIKTWLIRCARFLDPYFKDLSSRTILWRIDFTSEIGDLTKEISPANRQEVLDSILTEAIPDAYTIKFTVGEAFESALFQPENVSESALVEKFIQVSLSLIDKKIPETEFLRLHKLIVPSPDARQAHRFRAKHFRDYVGASIPDKVIMIDKVDDAYSKYGLGWRARDPTLGGDITGKAECTAYLNQIISLLKADLICHLKRFDRLSLVKTCLINHEAAALSRDRWRRTAAAVETLHGEAEVARGEIIEHEFQLNAVFQATRALIEIAVCECPTDGGMHVGQLDLSRLMTRVLQIAHLAGTSDAIHWGAMEPFVRVTPLGDIHFNFEFFDEVVKPYSKRNTDILVEDAKSKYSQNFSPDTTPENASETDDKFLDAFKEELGASIEDYGRFVAFLESIAIKTKTPLMLMTKTEILEESEKDDEFSGSGINEILDNFTLKARLSWDSLPDGYTQKDIDLWRFRRRLSLLRRPIVRLDQGDEPTYVIAPGILRESLMYILDRYHQGEFRLEQITSERMKAWKVKVDGERGDKFEKEVQAALDALGWKTEHLVNITKIFGRSFDRNYGEVDVLAWSEEKSEILIVECKDEMFRRTPGEISEQLSDYRGLMNAKGKRDNLLKHLDRVELIEAEPAPLVRYCGADDSYNIRNVLVFSQPVPMQFQFIDHAVKTEVYSIDDVVTDFK